MKINLKILFIVMSIYISLSASFRPKTDPTKVIKAALKSSVDTVSKIDKPPPW